MLLIGLLTNFSLKHIHAVLYAIARSVPCRLNITSSYFLGKMNKKRFSKSLERRNSFNEAVDLEVCSHMHLVSVFHLSENLGRIANSNVPCPPELDKTCSRCAHDFDTKFMFQDAFDGFQIYILMKGRDTQLLQIARVLGRGSPNAGTLVCQVSHWFYVGNPRATASYKACISALLPSDKLHLDLLARLIHTHGKLTVFARCSYRSAKEATQNYVLGILSKVGGNIFVCSKLVGFCKSRKYGQV